MEGRKRETAESSTRGRHRAPQSSTRDGATLRRATETCLDLFAQCLRVQNFSNARFLWLEDCQARFRWWAFGLNASSSGRGSLDRLLAHREDVRDAVSGLLRSLASALDACLTEPGPLSLADDVDDAQSDASSYCRRSPHSVNSQITEMVSKDKEI